MAKDFSNLNTERMYDAVSKATGEKNTRSTAGEQEAAERAATFRTRGRKGCKMPRMNMAFTPQNRNFISIMAKASGLSMTQYTNAIIAAYQKEHPELLEKAEAFLQFAQSQTNKLQEDAEELDSLIDTEDTEEE